MSHLVHLFYGMANFIGILAASLGITLALVQWLGASKEEEAVPPEADRDDDNWHKMV